MGVNTSMLSTREGLVNAPSSDKYITPPSDLNSSAMPSMLNEQTSFSRRSEDGSTNITYNIYNKTDKGQIPGHSSRQPNKTMDREDFMKKLAEQTETGNKKDGKSDKKDAADTAGKQFSMEDLGISPSGIDESGASQNEPTGMLNSFAPFMK